MVSTEKNAAASRHHIRRTGLVGLLHRTIRRAGRRCQRSAPPTLSDIVLREVGLTRTDIEIGADKLFRKP
jgi:hypothetical protein